MIDRIAVYSQTEHPDDDSDDGEIIAFGTFEGETMIQCWVVARDEGECSDSDEISTDAIGVEHITCKNLTTYDIIHDDPKQLGKMLGVLESGGIYIEINPMYFRLVSQKES